MHSYHGEHGIRLIRDGKGINVPLNDSDDDDLADLFHGLVISFAYMISLMF